MNDARRMLNSSTNNRSVLAISSPKHFLTRLNIISQAESTTPFETSLDNRAMTYWKEKVNERWRHIKVTSKQQFSDKSAFLKTNDCG